MFEWLFRNGSKATFKQYGDDVPYSGLDNTPPTVLSIQTDQQPIERKEVNKMPVAKQRNVRYTGNFSFIVPADQPGKAAEVLETIRQHGTVSNVRSVNVKAEGVEDLNTTQAS